MNNMNNINNDIKKAINNAKHPSDLLPLLNLTQIPITELKEFCIGQMAKLELSEQEKCKYKTLSIHYLFPDDVIQVILSFELFHNNRLKRVCKLWSKLINLNEEKHYNKDLFPILPQEYNPEENNKWILRPDRENGKRNDVEEKLNIAGVYNDLRYISRHTDFKAGDIILVHAGKQEFSEYANYGLFASYPQRFEPIISITTNCSIYGVNPNGYHSPSKTKVGPQYEGKPNIDTLDVTFLEIGSESHQCSVHIRGISFDMIKNTKTIQINEGCSLSMFNCGVSADCVAIDHFGNNLTVNKCHIEGDGAGIRIGYDTQKVSINNSTFVCTNGVNYGCIELQGSQRGMIQNLVHLECKGNSFKSEEYPIVEKDDVMKYRESTFFELDNNRWTQLTDDPEVNKLSQKIHTIKYLDTY